MNTTSSVSAVPQDIIEEFCVAKHKFMNEELLEKLLQAHRPNSEDAINFCDLGAITRKFFEWKAHFPRVEPYYAMKCNPSQAIIRTLFALGVKFDCASEGEMANVLRIPGIEPRNDILFAHPCKQTSHLNFAKDNQVVMMTFDNEDELHKIHNIHPQAQLLLRIETDDSHAVCRLSTKFGAPLSDCARLLAKAIELNLNVIGVSFHVGSGQPYVSAFTDSLDRAHYVFTLAEQLGLKLRLLDIGGGFPGHDSGALTFPMITAAMNPKLDALFPNTRIIAEPGRFFAHGSVILCANVIGRRKVSPPTKVEQSGYDDVLYYVNDGVYASFNSLIYDHASVIPRAFRNKNNGEMRKSTVFGPTCDGLDCIVRSAELPEMKLGDWMYFEGMGAYTVAAGSTFNGFRRTEVIFIETEM